MICIILDRSGSMQGRETDVIGGVNSFLDEQKKLPDPASIALVRFDDQATERFRAMGPLADCAPLTADDYKPRGSTPLLDAIGRTVTQLDDDWKAQQPERAIVVVVTDGQENASREYTKTKIKELIESRQASGKWSFIYLGANVDAFGEAGAMGFVAANTAGYTNTKSGTQALYSTMDSAIATMRATGSTLAHNLGTANIGEANEPDKKAKTWTTPKAKQQWQTPV